MREGISNPLVPEFLLSSHVPDTQVYFSSSGHDEGMEMFWLKNDDVVIVLLALVVVVTLGKEICLLVLGTGLMMKNEVVLSGTR